MAETSSEARGDDPFVEYYTRESISPRTIERRRACRSSGSTSRMSGATPAHRR
jgi:hypothetical protein